FGLLGASMKRTKWRVPMTCVSAGHACAMRNNTDASLHRHDSYPRPTGTTYHGTSHTSERKSSVRAHSAWPCAHAGGQAVRRDGAMVCLGGGQTAGLAVHAEGAAGDRPPLVLLARSAAARHAQCPQGIVGCHAGRGL